MKQLISSIAVVALCAAFTPSDAFAQKGTTTDNITLTKTMTKQDSNMYALGMQIGRSLQSQGLSLNVDMIADGMRGFLSGNAKLTDQQFQACMENLQQEAMAKMQAEQSAKGSANKERGEKFLAENTLLGQAFVINPDLTVEQAAKEAGVEITGYARVAVGEGVEKKQEDFAAEVAKALQG